MTMPDTSSDLIAGLVQNLQPVRRLRRRVGLAAAGAAAITATAFVVLVLGARSDLAAGDPDPLFLVTSGLFAVLAMASTWAVLEMARPYVGNHRDGWIWAAAMAALLPASALLTFVIGWMHAEMTRLDSDGWNCLSIGMGLGLLTATALTFWLRRGAPVSPDRAGLLTGIAAGSTGIFAIALGCPHDDIAHIGVWHGGAVVISAVIGRLVIPRLIKW